MTTIDPKTIADLRAAEAKATPGPWRPKREPPPVGNVYFDRHTADGSFPVESRGTAMALGVAVGVTHDEGDAQLIALLRNHAPALLSAAERCGEAQATLDEVAHVVGAVHDQSTGPSYPGTDREVLEAVRQMMRCESELIRARDALAAKLAEVSADLARVTAERDEAQRSNVAFVDSNTRMSTVVHAALLWHRGETQAEESRNDDGLRAAVEEYLARAEAVKPGVG